MCTRDNTVRPAIIRMHKNEYSERRVAEILSIPNFTVHKAIQRHRETESNEDRPRSQ